MTNGPAKQQAQDLIAALPDSATWTDVLYVLETAADIQQGLRDVQAGRVVDSEALRNQLGLTN